MPPVVEGMSASLPLPPLLPVLVVPDPLVVPVPDPLVVPVPDPLVVPVPDPLVVPVPDPLVVPVPEPLVVPVPEPLVVPVPEPLGVPEPLLSPSGVGSLLPGGEVAPWPPVVVPSGAVPLHWVNALRSIIVG